MHLVGLLIYTYLLISEKLPHNGVSLIFHLESISVWILPTILGTSKNACHLSAMIIEHCEVIRGRGLWTSTNTVSLNLTF